MNQASLPELSAPRIAFIKAGWHADIVNNGYQGFSQAFKQLTDESCSIEVFDVPGAFEIPLLAKDLAKTGNFSAVLCCGLIVDGSIYRHEYVAEAVISGLMQVQLEVGIPVLSVVLTPKNFSESEDEHAFFLDHFKIKGQEAAEACLKILQTRKQALGS